MSKKVSVFILAYNSEDRIERAVKSVLWADEVVVVDSYSKDRTAEIAEKLGATVAQVKFEGFGKLRLAGIKHTTYDWIFSLDSDEECTSEAEREIREIINSENPKERIIHQGRIFLWDNLYGLVAGIRLPSAAAFPTRKDDVSAEELVHEGYRLDGRLGIRRIFAGTL